MPELPEVETTLRGIKPHFLAQKITNVIVRHPRLRWPIPADLKEQLVEQQIINLYRRAKYILFAFKHGTLILHLGMSGRVRVLTQDEPAKKHDHVDIVTEKHILRFTDPRRFGALLWTNDAPETHPLLAKIGPEPLSAEFSGEYLWQKARGRSLSVKAFIMDSAVVAGVGNIYATEALFETCIRPQTAAGKISKANYDALAHAIKQILKSAIKKGGTTLKDFMKSDGKPGYFSIELKAYGRAGEPCVRCGTKLKSARIGQRSTVYCPQCQT